MVEGKIGPIELDHSELYDDNSIEISGTEEFTLICTNKQARQIMGLAAINSSKERYGPIGLVTNDSSWGVVWIDTSLGLVDNEDMAHRGWYVINEAVPTTDLGHDYVHLSIVAEKLSSNEYEYLEMDYTPGYGDGTTLTNDYTASTAVYTLNEDFSDFDTSSVWYAAVDHNESASSAAASGGDLVMAVTASSAGTAGGIWTQTRSTYDNMSRGDTVEFGLVMPATPATRGGSVHFFMGPDRESSWSSAANFWNDKLLCVVNAEASGGYSYTAYGADYLGGWTTLIPKAGLSNGTLYWRIVWEKTTGHVSIYTSTNASTYTLRYHGGSRLSKGDDLYMGTYLNNYTTSSLQGKLTDLKIYRYQEVETRRNVVTLPATTPLTTADFSRASEDGNIPCYLNPTSSLYFWNDGDNFYNGSVRAYNSNYTDSTPRLLTWTDEVLDPGEFYVTNGIIKLSTTTNTATPVVVSYWDNPTSTYVTPAYLGVGGAINLLKPLYISPERHVYQINDTKWHISRGKPFVMVEHPDTDIGMVKRTAFYHDGILHNGLADNADVSMLSQFYSLHFNPYNLLTTNMYGVEEGLDGFYDVSSTLEQVSGATYGTYHLKCTSKNLQATEGVYLDEVSLLTGNNTGLIFGGRAYLKGTGTWKLLITERKSDDTALNTTSSAPFTLTSTPSIHNVYHTVISSEAEKLNLMIYTDGQQSAEFYGDLFQLAPSPVSNQAMYSISPLTANRYGMLIMKKDPTIIKSDSIPASDITGIGVYDQLVPPTDASGFSNLADEFMIQPWQRVGVRQL